MWTELLGFVGLGTVFLGILGYLFRSVFKHILDRDIAGHKANLESTYQIQLERTKAELQKSTIEHEIRYRNIHEKVAETIAETFARLLELQRAVGSYIAILEHGSEPPKDEKLEMVRKANGRFNDYYFPRQIYLPTELCDKISTLYLTLHRVTRQFGFGYSIQRTGREQLPVDYWQKTLDDFEMQAKPLFDDLRLTFHNMLYGGEVGSMIATETGVSVVGVDESKSDAGASTESGTA